MKTMKKYTEKSDHAYDKKHGIKEGSKKDKALDKKRGLAERPMKGIKAIKKKIHLIVIAPKKAMKGKMPMPIPMENQKPMGKLRNPSIYR